MNRILIYGLICVFGVINLIGGTIELEKKDYIKLLVSSYVNGFKTFDTTVNSFEDDVSVSIYYSEKDSEKEVDKLVRRFEFQVPKLLSRYEWAKNVNVRVAKTFEK